MKRYANKSEVMMELEKGGHLEGIRGECHLLRNASGEYTANIRYSLWKILTAKHIKHLRNERHGNTPVSIWALRTEQPPAKETKERKKG